MREDLCRHVQSTPDHNPVLRHPHNRPLQKGRAYATTVVPDDLDLWQQ